MKSVVRKMVACCLLLFAIAGSIMAQNDNHYVIKRIDGTTVHYLAHDAGGALVDATVFDPATCVWYSSNNYNYYFMDGTARKYLKAPLSLNGTISVADNPGTQSLNNTTYDYYFYDWDHGLARGIQHFGGTCPPEYNIPDNLNQCWQVVWVSYESGQWKMSSVYGYEPTPYSARFLKETETDYPETISNESGGVGNLADFSMSFGESRSLNGTASSYSYTLTPAYTYYHIDGLNDPGHNTNIPEENYYFYNNAWQNSAPTSQPYQNIQPSSYAWSIDCEGATEYLSFAEGSDVLNSSSEDPTLYYRTENTTGIHKLATLTLTVTYEGGATQTRTATVTVKTRCQNPTVLDSNIEVTYVGATISWLPSADEYKVLWKKAIETTWNYVIVGDITSYTISGLEYETPYNYKVQATCDDNDPTSYSFTTLKEPGLMVTGNIFGGGRMAPVGGNTEVVIINCDSVGGIFGGNDIAGVVHGANGSKIILGVNPGDEYASYGITTATVAQPLEFGSVYGGGNGYYAYDGASFVPATADYTEQTVNVGASVREMTPLHQVGDVAWTNNGTAPVTLNFPSIVKTHITVSGDYIKADSIFGGAKNAFLTFDDFNNNGSTIIVKGGTIMAVFGGNNFGGTQKRGKHYIEVNGTTTSLNPSIENTATTGYGRDFGIRYLFGGGNKVYGSTTDVEIFGGQCDTIFAGGNSADVYAANVTVNCAMGEGSGNTWNKVYSNAIDTYSGGVITPKDSYDWNGYDGIYNVRTLFGGNNMATFDSELNGKVPTINLVSGGLGTVYGGGNSGDMWGLSNDDGNGGSLVIEGDVVKYGTHVIMNSPTILVDLLYGGCQMSNVRYSTWVEIKNGHVGTVYGGCNVSGDVGSTRENPDALAFNGEDPNEDYQKVYGGTYVVASGGTVYKNLFGGGNGYYHCLNDYGVYSGNINYTNHNYLGLHSPTHNETHVVLEQGPIVVKGNVYAGGNLACVGFDNSSVNGYPYPTFVGLSSVNMKGGTVNGSVYGGSNMANVHGSCAALASSGTIGKALYGGNDRMGRMAQISNRVFPEDYKTASDNATSLEHPRVCTYVGLTGNPTIPNVFGGSNGYYAYFESFDAAEAYSGPLERVVSCDATNLPIQQNIFVDMGIDGGEQGAHIGTVYGGGDGVTVTGFLTVFHNVKTNPIGYSNVGTIFGGNNKGDLALVSDIILLNGQVNTVYGGCNEGAMTGVATDPIVGHTGIGSYVRLRDSYDGDGEGGQDPITPNIKITDAVYGGCRSNGITNNTMVLVEGGNHPTTIYGGSDITGDVKGVSQVFVTGGSIIENNNVYGGGNGHYDYVNGTYAGLNAPYCYNTHVEVLGGTCSNNVFGGGYAGECGETYVKVGGGTVNGNVFGGGNEAGLTMVVLDDVTTTGNSTVETTGGTVDKGIYGGCNTQGTIQGNVVMNLEGGTIGSSNSKGYVFGGGYGEPTKVDGNVTVNFGSDDDQASPYPTLYGELYGGSALGDVNTNFDNTTTVNILNGTITGVGAGDAYEYGKVFGGGLGRKAGDGVTAVEARVNGSVRVNIGSCTSSILEDQDNDDLLRGNATLINCDVFGCNNQNGSPQDAVEVHVYKTAHNENNVVDNVYGNFAVHQVIGGGNESSYMIHGKKAVTWIHGCKNTIGRLFGGGNAADVMGVKLTIYGGRLGEVFCGGNGERGPEYAANIGMGGVGGTLGTDVITVNIGGGLVTVLFQGSNMHGTIYGNINVQNFTACEELSIVDHFMGSNQSDIVGNITATIYCGPNFDPYDSDYDPTSGDTPTGESIEMNFVNLYCGSNRAQIHGDIFLTIEGGVFENLFGGSKGRIDDPLTPLNEDYASDIDGNVTLIITGGTIGNLYGGCDLNGNIKGKISINVYEDNSTCPLFIGNIYGGGCLTNTEPINSDIISPDIKILKGEIGGTTANLPILNNPGTGTFYAGNVYGGGYQGNVTSHPRVIVGDGTDDKAVNILGNVYGGGFEGKVNGSTQVIIVPKQYNFTYVAPSNDNVINVTDLLGNPVTSNTTLGEGMDLLIEANPSVYGQKFDHWEVTGANAGIGNATSTTTTFTMGTEDSELKPVFGQAYTHKLTIIPPASGHGSIAVYDGLDQLVNSDSYISEGAVLKIVASPDATYQLVEWTITGDEAEIRNRHAPHTIFTMGTSDATITASFRVAPEHRFDFEASPAAGGTIAVNGGSVSSGANIAEGTELTLTATPASGYRFVKWRIESGDGIVHDFTATTTTFIMRTMDTKVVAEFSEE
ncbi:MAG: fibronectin type III domain-containing protein [Bacteroidales bacterium]|nr:fibronectin type III domain-containing protein [Bacteroidales bacterium]